MGRTFFGGAKAGLLSQYTGGGRVDWNQHVSWSLLRGPLCQRLGHAVACWTEGQRTGLRERETGLWGLHAEVGPYELGLADMQGARKKKANLHGLNVQNKSWGKPCWAIGPAWPGSDRLACWKRIGHGPVLLWPILGPTKGLKLGLIRALGPKDNTWN